ncbi:MAG: 3-oxo-tetronate kinase [Gammaproteobacteria bacterium]
MLLGAVADDFTGASDIANTLRKGGMRTVQFVGVDADGAPADCEAGVVALKTRSATSDDAVRLSLEAARWLQAQGCRQILFKYCSTFDSTPAGNIGPVADALLQLTSADLAIVCPAFPGAGRRLFMGHLFVGDRLLSESGMEHHPLTPMTDPDIRRWLARQSRCRVGHIPLHTVRAGSAALREAFEQEKRAGHRLVVTDAIADEDLLALGAAATGHRLVTGGSGIALGLPRNFREQGLLAERPLALPTPRGAGVVLCGSCSTTSRRQVEAYRQLAPALSIDPAELLGGRMTPGRAAEWVRAQRGAVPIVFSTADPLAVTHVQAALGREQSAAAVERFFGELARLLANNGVRRIVVGGGETSGAVTTALGLERLWIGPEIDPGVPVLFAERGAWIGIALKSGNFGADDFFVRALEAVGSP